jgi:hypothetical protein
VQVEAKRTARTPKPADASKTYTERIAKQPSITGGAPDPRLGERSEGKGASVVGAAERLKKIKLPTGRFERIAGPEDGGADAAPIAANDELRPASGGSKALSAAARLRALGKGGSPPPPPSHPPAPSDRDPEADGSAPATSAAADGSSATNSAEQATAGPPPEEDNVLKGAELQPATGGGKALSAAARLKALGGRGPAPLTDPQPSARPTEAPPPYAQGPTEESLLKGAELQPAAGGGKALSAAARLKALGGRGPAPLADPQPAAPPLDAPPPEARGPAEDGVLKGAELQPATGGGKALSAAARLKALGGRGPAPLADPQPAAPPLVAQGPAEDGLLKGAGLQPAAGGGKALSAAARLRALGGRSPTPATDPQPTAHTAPPSPSGDGTLKGAELRPASGGGKALSAAARLKALGKGA